MKFNLFDDDDDHLKYKDLKNDKNYKFFDLSNKKDKRKNFKQSS